MIPLLIAFFMGFGTSMRLVHHCGSRAGGGASLMSMSSNPSTFPAKDYSVLGPTSMPLLDSVQYPKDLKVTYILLKLFHDFFEHDKTLE